MKKGLEKKGNKEKKKNKLIRKMLVLLFMVIQVFLCISEFCFCISNMQLIRYSINNNYVHVSKSKKYEEEFLNFKLTSQNVENVLNSKESKDTLSELIEAHISSYFKPVDKFSINEEKAKNRLSDALKKEKSSLTNQEHKKAVDYLYYKSGFEKAMPSSNGENYRFLNYLKDADNLSENTSDNIRNAKTIYEVLQCFHNMWIFFIALLLEIIFIVSFYKYKIHYKKSMFGINFVFFIIVLNSYYSGTSNLHLVFLSISIIYLAKMGIIVIPEILKKIKRAIK